MGPAAWSLLKLNEKLRRAAERAEKEAAAKQAAESTRTSDPQRAAFEARQAEQHAAMRDLIQMVKAREERRAQHDYEVRVRDAELPMTGVQWSPSSGR